MPRKDQARSKQDDPSPLAAGERDAVEAVIPGGESFLDAPGRPLTDLGTVQSLYEHAYGLGYFKIPEDWDSLAETDGKPDEPPSILAIPQRFGDNPFPLPLLLRSFLSCMSGFSVVPHVTSARQDYWDLLMSAALRACHSGALEAEYREAIPDRLLGGENGLNAPGEVEGIYCTPADFAAWIETANMEESELPWVRRVLRLFNPERRQLAVRQDPTQGAGALLAEKSSGKKAKQPLKGRKCKELRITVHGDGLRLKLRSDVSKSGSGVHVKWSDFGARLRTKARMEKDGQHPLILAFFELSMVKSTITSLKKSSLSEYNRRFREHTGIVDNLLQKKGSTIESDAVFADLKKSRSSI